MSPSNDFGVFQKLPFEKYQKIQGLNQSTLNQLLEDQKLHRKNYFNINALKFGNAGHCLLLEPEKFERLYICAPKNLNQRKNTGKEQWKEFCNLHKGKIILRYNDWSRLHNIRKCFQFHPEIQKLFSSGNSEVSLFWNDSKYGLNCKARLDWFDANSEKIIDLKFTQNISIPKKSNPLKNKFAIQAKWYSRGVYQLTSIVPEFFLIFIEKYAPHFIKILRISDDDLKNGQKQIDFIIKNFILKRTL